MVVLGEGVQVRLTRGEVRAGDGVFVGGAEVVEVKAAEEVDFATGFAEGS
jgi:hypothetical protein